MYNVDLPLTSITSDQQCIVQINLPHQHEESFVSVNNLQKALYNDPDLACIDRDTLCTTFQVLFTTSGCDYISFIYGFGKAAITYSIRTADSLQAMMLNGSLSSEKGELEIKNGFMTFTRMIGTMYFKKHLLVFVALKSVQTPAQLYHSITGQTDEERHKKWYNQVREIVSDRICTGQERVPSYTSIW